MAAPWGAELSALWAGPGRGVSSGPPAGEGAGLCPDGTPQALVFEFSVIFSCHTIFFF